MRLPPLHTPPRHLFITHAAPHSSHPPSPRRPPRLESPLYLKSIHHARTEAFHHTCAQSSWSPCTQHSQPPPHRRRTVPQTTTHKTRMPGLIAHRTISTDARVVKGADLRFADRRIAWVRTPLRALPHDDIIWPRPSLHRAPFAAQSITHSDCRLACVARALP